LYREHVSLISPVRSATSLFCISIVCILRFVIAGANKISRNFGIITIGFLAQIGFYLYLVFVSACLCTIADYLSVFLAYSYRIVSIIAQLMSIDSKESEQISRHVGGVDTGLSSTSQRPRHTEFVSESARLKSFVLGRVSEGQSAQALAGAGFLYVGMFLVHCSMCQFYTHIMPNTHRRRRRDETVLSRRRRRCEHEFATSWRQFRRVVGVSTPVGSRDS